MKIGDASAHVHPDVTAPDEHLPELLAPTLNAGLHARDRDARFSSRIGLCESANRLSWIADRYGSDKRPIIDVRHGASSTSEARRLAA